MYIFINSDQNISCLVLSFAIKGMNEKLNEHYEDYGNYFFGLPSLAQFLTSSSYLTQNQNMLHDDYVFFMYLILLVYFYHLWLSNKNASTNTTYFDQIILISIISIMCVRLYEVYVV